MGGSETIHERRAIAEFDLSGFDQSGSVSLTVGIFGRSLPTSFCVSAYEGDGLVSGADFQPDRTLLHIQPGEPGQNSEPFYSFDISEFVQSFVAEGNSILGLQLAFSNDTDTEIFFENITLTIAPQAIPEPGVLGLLGLGLIGLAAGRSKRRFGGR